MFRTIARFHLSGLRRPAPGPRAPIPANDNLQAALRPAARARARDRMLVCRWALTDDGTGLACRWHEEALASSAPEQSPARARHLALRVGP